MAGVLVFGEIAGGAVDARVAGRRPAAGAALARAARCPLHGALIGHDLGAAAGQLHSAVATLYLVESAQ